MIGFAAHRLMELEVEGVTGASHGSRMDDSIRSALFLKTGGAGGAGIDALVLAGDMSVKGFVLGLPRHRHMASCRRHEVGG
jgi:hypothetical protein